MRIRNKNRFIIRTIETLVILITIILTPIAIIYANKIRGHTAYGGEWLIPIISLMIILILEEYLESEDKKNEKNNRR